MRSMQTAPSWSAVSANSRRSTSLVGAPSLPVQDMTATPRQHRWQTFQLQARWRRERYRRAAPRCCGRHGRQMRSCRAAWHPRPCGRLRAPAAPYPRTLKAEGTPKTFSSRRIVPCAMVPSYTTAPAMIAHCRTATDANVSKNSEPRSRSSMACTRVARAGPFAEAALSGCGR